MTSPVSRSVKRPMPASPAMTLIPPTGSGRMRLVRTGVTTPSIDYLVESRSGLEERWLQDAEMDAMILLTPAGPSLCVGRPACLCVRCRP